jgi:solute carrier family 35 (UDP-sugar transporter), member A1/2/3
LIVSYLFLRLDPALANKATLWNLLSLLSRGRKLIVLVLLYTVANIIPFYAISIIGAPTFTVVMQLKIFTTAGFSTCMLGRAYSATKWRALVLLVIGCILVSSPILNKQAPPTAAPSAALDQSNSTLPSSSSSPDEQSSLTSDPLSLLLLLIESYGAGLLGLLATLLQASISGFSSVYFEALLKDKDDDTTIWERNFQLAFYSIIVMVLTVISQQILGDLSMAAHSSGSAGGGSTSEIFSNWTVLAVIIAILQALGGLLVAGTLRYADSVLKCFATAVSIGLTSIVGFFFLDNHIDFIVLLGYCVTIVSIFNYTLDTSTLVYPPGEFLSISGSIEEKEQRYALQDDEESDLTNRKLSK